MKLIFIFIVKLQRGTLDNVPKNLQKNPLKINTFWTASPFSRIQIFSV